MSTDCIFCQIISGNSPAFRLYEDDLTLAFMDIFPWAKGHCLVVPKEHAPTIFDLSEGAAQAVMTVVRKVAPALMEALGADGLNLFQANGQAAWQTVDHFHMHLIPRWHGDGLTPPGVPSKADDEDLMQIMKVVVAALRNGSNGATGTAAKGR